MCDFCLDIGIGYQENGHTDRKFLNDSPEYSIRLLSSNDGIQLIELRTSRNLPKSMFTNT
jgi:hypothetical protein